MLYSLQIIVLFIKIVIGLFPENNFTLEEQNYINFGSWAHSQVLIYYRLDFKSNPFPDCHGTLLTGENVLVEGTCVTEKDDGEKIYIIKVR